MCPIMEHTLYTGVRKLIFNYLSNGDAIHTHAFGIGDNEDAMSTDSSERGARLPRLKEEGQELGRYQQRGCTSLDTRKRPVSRICTNPCA